MGKCTSGENCIFAHSEEELDVVVPELDPSQVPEKDTRMQKKMSLCKWWKGA